MFFRPKLSVDSHKSVRFLNHFSPQVLFNGDTKKNCIKKLKSLLPKKTKKPVDLFETKRSAAVLIPLCIHNENVSLLYTLRAANLNTHRGQVSFPGGMRDQTDKSLEMTALRETYEELGIPPEEIEVWGSGNLIVTRQNMSILPVVGRLKSDLVMNNLVLNSSEVEEVFTVSIKDLCDSNYHAHTQFRNTYSTPVYLGGQHRIWGLTAIITHLFLKALLSEETYKHSVTYIPSVIANR